MAQIYNETDESPLHGYVYRSDKVGNSTIFSGLTVKVELYDSDYWDNSVVIEFQQQIVGDSKRVDFIDLEQKRILFEASNATILSMNLLDTVDSKYC